MKTAAAEKVFLHALAIRARGTRVQPPIIFFADFNGISSCITLIPVIATTLPEDTIKSPPE